MMEMGIETGIEMGTGGDGDDDFFLSMTIKHSCFFLLAFPYLSFFSHIFLSFLISFLLNDTTRH